RARRRPDRVLRRDAGLRRGAATARRQGLAAPWADRGGVPPLSLRRRAHVDAVPATRTGPRRRLRAAAAPVPGLGLRPPSVRGRADARDTCDRDAVSPARRGRERER